MDNKCLEVLQKIDDCLKDPDFQIIIIMKFMRSLAPILQSFNREGEEGDKRE
jgi:hypothetical protein